MAILPNGYYQSIYGGEEIDNLVAEIPGIQTALSNKAPAYKSIGLLGDNQAVLLSQPGWYRIFTIKNPSGKSVLLHVGNWYSDGGPSDLLIWVHPSPYNPELTVLSSGYKGTTMPIDNLRLVLIDSQTIALDLHYQLSVGNIVGHNYIRTAYSTRAAEIVEQNLVMVPDAVDNEQIIMTAEWMSPPMTLGVEYRTVERYQGKPVYIQLVSCGTFPTAGTTKQVTFAESNIQFIVDFKGKNGSSGGFALPAMAYNGVIGQNAYLNVRSTNNGEGIIYLGSDEGLDLTSQACYVWVKYTKTTD